jgi:hypothetical protein
VCVCVCVCVCVRGQLEEEEGHVLAGWSRLAWVAVGWLWFHIRVDTSHDVLGAVGAPFVSTCMQCNTMHGRE